MKALFLPIVLSAFAAPASAQSLQVVGYAGVLGEWELTATVTETSRLWAKEFSGPLSMKHVGICTQDGPEERTGEIRFRISALSSQLDATLLVEGQQCTYSARAADPYSGVMACPDGKAVPLKLWLK
ncbi:hypothetical protein [Bradyrhizobium sp.]|uniref:hypothetical protein n=1 Tax=Bradyrhizobium sp. TaxID=376 RepID=UPI002E039144|nr:hypothetical protein [Bradyrhizobium sp.]